MLPLAEEPLTERHKLNVCVCGRKSRPTVKHLLQQRTGSALIDDIVETSSLAAQWSSE